MVALNLDSRNTGKIGTTLTTTGTATALEVDNPNGAAISGTSSNGIGVLGQTTGTWIAMLGESTQGTGVLGQGSTGVVGWGDQEGVAGWASDIGVAGNGTVGVYGESKTGNGTGVWGQTTGQSNWPAVEGYSDTGNGVRGVSVGGTNGSNTGVVGFSQSGIGVVGITGSPVAGPTSVGGYFIGGLIVTQGPKSAAVPHPDGSHRLLYSMESPESWFEDFGRATLAGGKAEIALEASFAAVIRTDHYHVFLSPEGENSGLYVSRRTSAGFEVRENQGGTSSITFSYRVVGRRKDIEAPRLQKVALPHYEHDDMLKTPNVIADRKPPQLPEPAEGSRRGARSKPAALGRSSTEER